MTNELMQLLKTRRKILGISQATLAQKLGYPHGQFISNIERGTAYLPAKKMKRACKALGITTEDMIKTAVNDYRAEMRAKLGLRG